MASNREDETMKARDIFKALLEGKKVGTFYQYMYLNYRGDLCLEPEMTARKESFRVGKWLVLCEDVTVQPEDGP
jgi:hypothetical protein